MAVVTNQEVFAERERQRHVMKAVVASCLGWSLDLYDLFILLFVAPVIGRLFFPSEHSMLSLAAVYASFGVTLLMRPLGSALFGSFADTHGRKRAMIASMIGVGVSTAAFGLLPTVHTIGVAAPILFIILKLVQGVFVGGVVAATHTIGTESVAPRYRGAVSGLIGGGGAGLGALFASLAYLGMSALFPGDAFDDWGWRCMFFTGIVSAVLGITIFGNLEESPMFKKLQEAKAKNKARSAPAASPLRTLFSRDYRNILLVNLLLTIGGGSGYYLTSGFLPTYLKVVTHTPAETAGFILMLSSIGVVIASIATGHASTFIGRKKAFLVTGVARLLALPALALAMPHTSGTVQLALYVIAFGALGSMGYAPLLIFLNERFPTTIRATGTGLSWNMGFAIGGIMPTFVSLASPQPADVPLTLAIFLGGISAVFLLGALIVPETVGKLDAPDQPTA
ncbi:MFS transporter [Massilia sp. YIM B02763]|uniref:MFS transporter n=1 Tax=Massilia sp. YIM B02763 TaxID=3050130 RepID=UPI0025B63FAB|nr:MFS transporter [Massilia sp. YIM B02763]MDN4052335.1 MFS transporter [Massilia sp. YIM B02763]